MANFITGKEILAEIQKSKNSFCWFEDPDKPDFNLIAEERFVFSPGMQSLHQDTLEPGTVVRVMTTEHVPVKTQRSSKTGELSQVPIYINFPSFKQYTWDGESWRETARSHWKGSLSNGEFCQTHGVVTDKLGSMYLLLVNRYGTKSNWRGYGYLEEMKGQALINLSQYGLKYNEAKARGNQTFAYLTRIMKNSFQFVLKKEKTQDGIVDDIMFNNGTKKLTYNQEAQLDVDRYHGKIHTDYKSLRGEKPKKVRSHTEKTMFNSLFTIG